MNKLITKNPVQRFKEGKKIEKFQLGGNPKPGTVIQLAGKFYTRRNDGQWVDKDGKRYVSDLHKNVGVTEFRPFKDKVYIETSSGFKGYEYTDASGRKVREPINSSKVTRTSNRNQSMGKQSQPVKKSVRTSESAVATNTPKEGWFTKKLKNATRVSFPMLNITDAANKVIFGNNKGQQPKTTNNENNTNQPTKKSIRVSKSDVTTNQPNKMQKVVDVAANAFDALPGGFQLFPGLRMPIDVYKTRQGKESNWSLLKPIAPYLFPEVSPNTNQKITNRGDLNIISSNTPDWLLRRMGPTPATVVKQPVQETEVEQPVQETGSVPTVSSETPTSTSTTVTSSATNLGKRNSGRRYSGRNSGKNYRTTKIQSNILSTPPSYNIEDLSGQVVTPTFENVTTTIETPNIIAPTATYNRRDTRQFLRDIGFNPYNFTGDQRRALRMVINGVADDYDRNLVQQMGL